MITSIYRKRKNGDYSLVAAFNTEDASFLVQNWLEEIADWLKAEGDNYLIIESKKVHSLEIRSQVIKDITSRVCVT